MNLPSHGANPAHLYEASDLEKPDSILDFSVNTNPGGPPEWLKELWSSFIKIIEDYPDPTGKAASEAIASRLLLSSENILLGNGAAELIHFIARSAAGERVCIVMPAFSEYEEACTAYGCEINHVPVDVWNWKLPVEKLVKEAENAAVLFICSPNNPTGQVFTEAEIIELLQKTASSNTMIVIDEAFYDFAGESTITAQIQTFPHLAVLHSMTKMYAVAGLRIGYLAASGAIIEKLKPYCPHWNVNAIALQTAQHIAADHKYASETRKWIEKERERVMNKLTEMEFDVLPSAVNFYLFKDPALGHQQPLLHYLLQKGIVLRHTENFHGLDGRWLRAAVKKRADNDILLSLLKKWKSA